MKSDALPTHYTPDGLVFDDGTELKADVTVFTTGFVGNLRDMAGSIVGSEIQEQLEDFCGVDAEGEILGGWKPTGRMFPSPLKSMPNADFCDLDPGIWYVGGAIGQARCWSRFIALQIQACQLSHPLEVYDKVSLEAASVEVSANGTMNGHVERDVLA